MKKVVITLFAAFMALSLSAQDNLLTKGEKVVNVGIGLGSTLYSGSGYTSTIPPVSASFEIGVKDDVLDVGSIGVGGYLGYASSKWEYSYFGSTWGYKYTNIILGARGSFHYPLVDKLDTYTGLMIGFNIVSAKETGTVDPLYNYSASSSGLIWSWYAGGRYYFTDNFAAMAEIGYGIAWLNLGVALKL
ncbi:MAG: porin family protein [Lentimicrobium sp.]|nr:porin family protein [Lentimicrobium sp.]